MNDLPFSASSSPLHEGRLHLDIDDAVHGHVSIHAPTWGATRCPFSTAYSASGFNPRPHMGGDMPWRLATSATSVSIHAPTWGATGLAYGSMGNEPVSIHAPTWGATTSPQVRDFIVHVSIHAPTWGATLFLLTLLRFWQFQSTPPHGGRPTSWSLEI